LAITKETFQKKEIKQFYLETGNIFTTEKVASLFVYLSLQPKETEVAAAAVEVKVLTLQFNQAK